MAIFSSLKVFLIIPFALIYLYSFLNLYAGRKARKYKVIMVIMNALILIGYISLMFYIEGHPHAIQIFIFVIIFIVIVTGLIGSVLYDSENAINRSRSLKLPLKIMRGIIVLILTYLIFNILMTTILSGKTVTELNALDIIFDLREEEQYCDSSLLITRDENATLFIQCDNKKEFLDGAKSIEITHNGELIHSNSIENYIGDLSHYEFEIDFNKLKSDVSAESSFLVNIEYEKGTQILEFSVYNIKEKFIKVKKALWE